VAEQLRDDQATFMRFGRISPKEWPWADPRVRVAIRRSIDFRKIGEFLSNRAEFEAAGVAVELRTTTHINQKRAYWLDPEKGELGALSQNYLYAPAEAKKLTAAAGYTNPIELPFFVEPRQGAIQDSDQLLMDSLAAAGPFTLKVHRAANSVEQREYRTFGRMDGMAAVANTGEYDPDFFIAALTNRGTYSEPAYPDPRIETLLDAQRREIDVERRYGLLKEFQMITAELMPTVPGYDLFSVFQARWPWLHNFNYGQSGSDSPPQGRPRWGGHLHWLDSSMPNRERGAS
jgi:ABC-type transport system substrate-binding protein